MNHYKKIVVAIDINTSDEIVLNKAISLAHNPKYLHLVHVTLSRTYFEPYGVSFIGEFVSDSRQKAEQRLQKIAKQHSIPAEQIHSVIGKPADKIHDIAENIAADLIVIGTHGPRGIKLLLGSTANGVLHGAKCDVLAVKV
jgi:universal stress protein A